MSINAEKFSGCHKFCDKLKIFWILLSIKLDHYSKNIVIETINAIIILLYFTDRKKLYIPPEYSLCGFQEREEDYDR